MKLLFNTDSAGFDVAKTGDARIGFVGKSDKTQWIIPD